MKRLIPSGLLCLLLSIPMVACSDLKDNVTLPIGRDGYALVLINLGYPDTVAAANPTILDRLRRFLTTEAHAQSAPPALVGSATVRVVGADIGIIEQTFTGNPVTVMSLEVPAGLLRTIEVTAFVSTSDPSAAASFRGTTVANLPSGTTVSVPMSMGLDETKLLFPDNNGGLAPGALVQINDISGAGYVRRTGANISGWANGDLVPRDVDFDSAGSLFIANQGNRPGIWKFNNINGSTKQLIVAITPTTLGIDRTRRYIYYSNGSTLARCNLDGTGTVNYSPGGVALNSVNGIGVDETTGRIYIAGANFVKRFDPATNAVLDSTWTVGGGNGNGWDVIVKGATVYVARATTSLSGPSDIRIYTLDLSLVSSITRIPPGSTFLGPRCFLAVPNRRIFFFDEDQGDNINTNEGIIGFDPSTNQYLGTYLPANAGQSTFIGYDQC